MRCRTPALVLPFVLIAGGSAAAAGSAIPHDLTLPCTTSDALLSVATVDAARPRGHALDPVRVLVTAPSRQQRSGDGTGESDSRSGACDDAQAGAANAAERACEGPFTVDRCRCERDDGDPDDPDDDVWSCTAFWRCTN